MESENQIPGSGREQDHLQNEFRPARKVGIRL